MSGYPMRSLAATPSSLTILSRVRSVDEFLAELARRGLYEQARLIADSFHITPREMFDDAPSNHPRCSPKPRARAAFYLHLHDALSWSYPSIGRLVGRDHTTVLAACAKLRRTPDARPSVTRLRVQTRLRVAP
jgi:chromosomal replication initiation ATPase DnaA